MHLGRHDVVAMDIRDAETLVDVCDFDAVKNALAGCQAVVHLGGISNNEAAWLPIYEVNIGGTYNVFEAARIADCNRVIFASSNHAVGGYEVAFEKPALYRGQTGQLIGVESPPRPDGYYGVSKVFGEAIGRYYSDAFGMRVGCIRIGSVTPTDRWRVSDRGRFRPAPRRRIKLRQLPTLKRAGRRVRKAYGLVPERPRSSSAKWTRSAKQPV